MWQYKEMNYKKETWIDCSETLNEWLDSFPDDEVGENAIAPNVADPNVQWKYDLKNFRQHRMEFLNGEWNITSTREIRRVLIPDYSQPFSLEQRMAENHL